jgi:hypothetical protein
MTTYLDSPGLLFPAAESSAVATAARAHLTEGGDLDIETRSLSAHTS